MARFKYLGEKARTGLVKAYGPCTVIRIPKKDGSYQELSNPTGFPVDEDIGADVTDQRALVVMRADDRFEEI